MADDLSWSEAKCFRMYLQVGLALFDLKSPEICIKRGNEWIFGPIEPYEVVGDVNKVVFPCGYTIAPDGDTINLLWCCRYKYGSCNGSITECLAWLDSRVN